MTVTSRVAHIAHVCGIPVEAELGKVLQSADGVTEEDVRAAMTNPAQARDFVERTGCDALAIACGSVHAMRSAEAELVSSASRRSRCHSRDLLVLRLLGRQGGE